MNHLPSKLILLLLASSPAAALYAQSGLLQARPQIRIHQAVNRNVTSVLHGTYPNVVNRASIGTRLGSDTLLKHMILVLKSSDDQKAALHTLLDAQQDKNSPSFHKWMSPEDFAAQFGVAQSDIATVSNWLASSGLQVESVAKGGRFITFSGSVGSVESAFHTEMHHLTVNGEAHISNTTDVAIPAALASVVRGVKSLNNFYPKTSARDFRKISMQKNADGSFTSVDPLYGGSATGTHYVGAGDLATIFNATPLQQAGNTGKGVTISVLARSNIQLSDVDTYRALFGLSKNTPNVIVIGSDPGQNADDIEAYLDAEMAGSLAQDANVNFIVSSASLVGGGIDTAGLYAVDNNVGDIISLSYGGCEANDGASGTAFWSQLWEQAAAQGQTAFISSGDSGAAGCDSSSATYATGGYGVNALSASAYSVSVGGTMFVDFNPAKYWGSSTAIPYATALSYIPEAALNQSRLTSTLLNSASTATMSGSGIFAGGGGIGIYTARPAWQKGSGIPTTGDAISPYSGTGLSTTASPIAGLHRLQPDVSFISANGHDGTLFCAEGSCYQNTSGGLSSAGIVGGTSVAAPAMASAQALINAANGGRQGNANIYYYALADKQYTASTTACQALTGSASSPATTLPASTCYFQDTVSGSNTVPTASSGTAGVGFNAVAGYDEASGLGSPNIANLARDWKTITFNATSTTLSLSPTTAQHGSSQAVTVQVTPASGSGTPTGDVSLIASQTSGYGSPITLTLSAGNATANINNLPAGTYTVVAHYAGDTTFAASDSAPVTVTISKENSTTSLTPYSITSNGAVNNTTSFTYGAAEIYLDTEVVAASGNGTASGGVTYTITRNGQTLAPLSTNLDTLGSTYFLAGPGFANFYLLPNYATLTPGTYVVRADYAGDVSFNNSSSTTTFTVAKAAPAVSFTTSTAQINAGTTATFNYTVTTPTAASPATGVVTFTDTTTGQVLGSAGLSNGAAVFTTGAITSAGPHTVTATYAGDTNYNAAAGTSTTVTVSGAATSTTSLGANGTLIVGGTVTLTASVSPVPTSSATVSFYDGGVLIRSAAVSTSNGTASLSYAGFTAGTHTVTAKFAGTSTVAASTGTQNVTIAKSTTSMRVGGANSSPYGTAVQLEGAFSRSPSTTTAPAVAPTGVINFYDGGSTSGALIGSAAPVFGVGGYATYESTVSVSNLSVGSHSIVAYYAGDANYSASTSITKPLTITAATPAVSVAPVTITYGTASATLSAAIAFAGGTAPSGAVTFTVDNGSSVNGSCTVAGTNRNCTATYPTGSLSGGNHTITATEAGDGNYTAVSGTATLTVNAAANGTANVIGATSISQQGNGTYLVTLTLSNNGNGVANAVVLSGFTLGSAAGTPVPQNLGTIQPGASVTTTVVAPASAGSPGSTVVERFSGTFTGGSFSGSLRAKLPAPAL